MAQGPKRDRLEVGLDRHAKRKRSIVLPEWLEERAGVFILILITIAIGLPYRIYMSFKDPAAATTQGPTELALAYGPAKSFMPGSSTRIKEISMKLRNKGNVPAEQIDPAVFTRTGPIILYGPKILKPGESATYASVGELNLPSSEPLTPHLGCANCPVKGLGIIAENDPNYVMGHHVN